MKQQFLRWLNDIAGLLIQYIPIITMIVLCIFCGKDISGAQIIDSFLMIALVDIAAKIASAMRNETEPLSLEVFIMMIGMLLYMILETGICTTNTFIFYIICAIIPVVHFFKCLYSLQEDR